MNNTEYRHEYRRNNEKVVQLIYRKDTEISDIMENVNIYCKVNGISRNQFILNAIREKWEKIEKE